MPKLLGDPFQCNGLGGSSCTPRVTTYSTPSRPTTSSSFSLAANTITVAVPYESFVDESPNSGLL